MLFRTADLLVPPKFHISPSVITQTLAPEYVTNLPDEDVGEADILDEEIQEVDEANFVEDLSVAEKQFKERL